MNELDARILEERLRAEWDAVNEYARDLEERLRDALSDLSAWTHECLILRDEVARLQRELVRNEREQDQSL